MRRYRTRCNNAIGDHRVAVTDGDRGDAPRAARPLGVVPLALAPLDAVSPAVAPLAVLPLDVVPPAMVPLAGPPLTAQASPGNS
jgi:hypothetical protein